MPLAGCQGDVPRNRHNALVVPPFPNLAGYEGMTEVMKMQVCQVSLPPGGLEGRLPPFGHGFAFPGKHPAIAWRYLPLPLFLVYVL